MAFILLALGLLIFPLDVQAVTINLYNSFPDHQGDNGFYAYKYNGTTYTFLTEHPSNQYYFSEGGLLPYVFTTGSPPPWIQMQPDYSLNPNPPPTFGYGEDAVLAWVVPETNTYHISGSFWDTFWGSTSDIKAYIKQNATVLWDNGGNPIPGSSSGGIPA